MQISREVCGFTGGEADTLRKAIGKKKKDVMDKMMVKFIDGAVANGYARDKAEGLYEDLRAFAAALHQAGMIDGLRGARLRPADAPASENLQGVTPVLSDAAESRLADLWWHRQQEQKS
jgi:hypothetical protein